MDAADVDGGMNDRSVYNAILWSADAVFPVLGSVRMSFAVDSRFIPTSPPVLVLEVLEVLVLEEDETFETRALNNSIDPIRASGFDDFVFVKTGVTSLVNVSLFKRCG